MTSSASPVAEPTAAGGVTTIDLWKTAALALILADHIGFFLLPDQPWLMALGRAALPIFFFLIGFARTRPVPWFWWATGLGLTGLDVWRAGSLDGVTLNIMISFGLIRLCLPLIETQAFGDWRRVAFLALALAALDPWVSMVIDYGTNGPLLALVGLSHRRALEAGPDRARDPDWLTRRALGAFATLAYAAGELSAYQFAVPDAWVMAVAVIAVSGLLLRFRAGTLAWRPEPLLAAPLRFCGRHSLEIYVAQVVGLMALGAALGITPVDLDDEEMAE